jgi:hypothetical protein
VAYDQVPTLSPDGRWVWDGYRWNPTPAVLHKWRWAGDRWVPRSRFPPLPKWLIWNVLAWAPFLIAWIPSIAIVASNHAPRRTITTVAVVLGGLAVLATVAFGSALGYRRQWGYLAWSFLFGSAMIGAAIFLAFDSSQPSNAPDDPGLGLGAMLVTVALLPVVALCLWLGGAIGILIRRLRD